MENGNFIEFEDFFAAERFCERMWNSQAAILTPKNVNGKWVVYV